MKTNIQKQIILAALALTPLVATADIGGIIEGDFSIYDVSGAYSQGGQFGISYASEHGTHYLLGGAFFLEQEDSQSPFGGDFDVESAGFGIAYRYEFTSFQDWSPYVEYGWNTISASYNTTDGLGFPMKLESDNSGDYLAVGILYRLWGDLYLKTEIGYYGLLSEQRIDTPIEDALGNPKFAGDTVQFSGSIGISLKF